MMAPDAPDVRPGTSALADPQAVFDLWLPAASLRGADRRRWRSLSCRSPDAGTLRRWLHGLDTPADTATARLAECVAATLARARRDAARLIDASARWCDRAADHAIVGLDAPDYPPLLRRIDDAPAVLYVDGQRDTLTRPALAIVGSRRATPGALEFTARLAADLAATGITIVSGLANGIDGAAHRGALDTGTTVAMLATAIDGCYPPRHQDLSMAISHRGARVSEFPLGSILHPGCFPKRNRLISGIAHGVVVVEATLPSGSLITARHALDQNREVMAVPGDVHNPAARGCHALLRDGAGLVESAADVLRIIGPLLSAELRHTSRLETPASTGSEAAEADDETVDRLTNDADARILNAKIGFDPVDIDTLVRRTGLPAAGVMRALGVLESEGRVLARPGGRFVKSVDRRPIGL